MTQQNDSPVPSSSRGRFRFYRFAANFAEKTGSAWVFFSALGLTLIWLVTGPMFQYSDTWQLVMNTFTSVVTFLMVFLIQNTQNRDTRAMNLKLDEIIRSIGHAHNEMINIEHLSDEELEQLEERYKRIREEHQSRMDQSQKGAA